MRMHRLQDSNWNLMVFVLLVLVLGLTGCTAQRRKSNEELGLTPQQASGRKVYDSVCDRCHEPYSSGGRQGPSMKGVFKKPYLPLSGLPANDERVGEIVRYGRSKMPGYGQALSSEQITDLIVYLHTL
jgi:mono/diheme cytochrome c family protein